VIRSCGLAALAALLALGLSGCGGGGSGPGSNRGCTGNCATDSPQRLEVTDVQRILTQAVDEARAQGAAATIAVTDRVGNVLAVFRMNAADTGITVDSLRATGTGLDGLSVVPDTLAVIAKAITGAYLSSEGNAFTTRTASQIVQEHFNPRERDQPGGPLFGVQFSQLPCSDLNLRQEDSSAGPKRSPLGLSADPGGLPLYKGGTVVGGVGVIADGRYSLDLNVNDSDRDLDELIAIAASAGFEAPTDRRADRITAGGLSLRFSDVEVSETLTGGRSTLTFAAALTLGALQAVAGYNPSGSVVAGTRFGQPESGYQAATAPVFAGLDAFELVLGSTRRFPPTAGADGLLAAADVAQLLRSAITVANRLRAQIRTPYGTQMRGTVSVVDTNGNILGVLRTRDAPVFGTDVSLQKARSALFFSSPTAAADLNNAGSVRYFVNDLSTQSAPVVFADYATATVNLLGPTALDGSVAYGERSIGNLARPFFPDGIEGSPPGPLSKPFAQWSPFSTGLQLDVVYERIIQHVGFVAGLGVPDVGASCAGPPAPAFGFNTTVPAQLRNGLQIFAGGVPIYRGSQLVGAIGVSGDGIDQDDTVAFLGVHEAARAGANLNNAPPPMRADQLAPSGGNLRYVQCPQAPFIDSDEQRICEGK
jgi:uncharacterized protein GlcG (DUF336 family)